MEREFSTTSLSKFLDVNINNIEQVRSEVAEIQTGFNSAYVEWKAKHDAELARLTLLLFEQPERAGAQLGEMIRQRQVKELSLIELRRKELSSVLIPSAQKQADGQLARAQQKEAELRKLNPKLNQKEESLKNAIASNMAELQKLQDQIKQLSRGLGAVFRFSKIGELDRKRQRLIGKLEEQQASLRDVRDQWEKEIIETGEEESRFKVEYQQAVAGQAQLQAELNYLNEPAGREKLVVQRSIRNTLDELKSPVECPDAEVGAGLTKMIENNIRTDDYLQGLEAVGGLIGLLGGVQEGMRRFNESVVGLHNQEEMHSQYLSKLKIQVQDDALTFNEQWGELLKATKDEKAAAAHPADFYKSVRPYIEQGLSNDRLQAVFESLGRSLQVATKSWK